MSALLLELHEQRLTGGYFDCCGMSRIRGHAELCPNAIAAATGTAKTPQAVECEASQSGHEVASPKPSQGAEQQQCRSGR